MTRWIRSFWDEEHATFFWEIGEDGWVTRSGLDELRLNKRFRVSFGSGNRQGRDVVEWRGNRKRWRDCG